MTAALSATKRGRPASRLVWYGVLLLIMFGWATVYPASKYIVDETGPLLLSFLRYSLGTIPLIPFFLRERRRGSESPRISLKDLLWMTFIGLFGIAGFSTLMFFGVRLSTAANSSLLVNTQPIFAAVFAPLILGEAFTPGRLLGAVVGAAGLFLVVTGGPASEIVWEGDYFTGNLLLAGASLSMAFYGILIKPLVNRYGSMVPTFITMLTGSLFLLVPVLVKGFPPGFLQGLSGWEVLLLLYVGAGGTAVTFLMFNRAVPRTGVVTAMGFKLFIPLFGTILSIVLLGERPGLWVYLGMIIIILSVFLIQRKSHPENKFEGSRKEVYNE